MKFLTFVTASLATFTVVSALTVDPQQSANPNGETIVGPNVSRGDDLLGGTLSSILGQVLPVLQGLLSGAVGEGGASCGTGGGGGLVSSLLLVVLHLVAGDQLASLLAPVCGILNTVGGTAAALNNPATAGIGALNNAAGAGAGALNNAAAAGAGALNNAAATGAGALNNAAAAGAGPLNTVGSANILAR